MRPYTLVRVGFIALLFAWVLSAIIPLLEPPKHVRATDKTAPVQQTPPLHQRPTDLAGMPAHQVNPHPALGAAPPPPPLNRAQVAEALRAQGYTRIDALQRQADGAWVATASRTPSGTSEALRIDRDGRIEQQ
jgi:hypothetical protein